MAAINDGGPAFPTTEQHGLEPYTREKMVPVHGMSLRDYFAAKAMPEIMDKGDRQQTLPWPEWCTKCAAASYEMADAMLKARGDRT